MVCVIYFCSFIWGSKL